MRGESRSNRDAMKKWDHLLIVQYNVGSPDVIGGNVEHMDPAVLFGLPAKFVIVPRLFNPKVGGHDLIFQILEQC